MLPPQGESLLSLAQQLGLRVFNRHAVQKKQLSQVQALQQRYYQYLHLLASDTQARPVGGRGWDTQARPVREGGLGHPGEARGGGAWDTQVRPGAVGGAQGWAQTPSP